MLPSKSLAIKTTDYPYTQFQAQQIEYEAKKQIKEQIDRLFRVAGMRLELAPEIEFTTKHMKRNNFLAEILKYGNKFLEPFRHFISKEIQPYAEVYDSMLEIVFPKTDPLSFIDGVKVYKSYLKRLARILKYPLEFFANPYGKKDPGMHINFSLWEGAKNIFYDSRKPVDQVFREVSFLTSFILNRLVEDTKNAIYLFACGKNSAKRIYKNGNETSACSWTYCKKSDENWAKRSDNSIVLRDYDKQDTARIEIRRFSDNSGLDSLKTLFILRSVTDSLDYLIRTFKDKLVEKPKEQSLAEFLELCLSKFVNPRITNFTEVISPTRDDLDYQLSNIFPSIINGSENVRQRFQESKRMKEMFGPHLHAMVSA